MKLKQQRWFRWICAFCVFLVCWVVVVPTLQALWIRYRVVSAILSAQSVRLEEFRFGQVLTRYELPPDERASIRAAIPMMPDVGLPGVLTLCYLPHHRIITRDASGREFTFTVCFHCDEARIDDGRIFMTPFLWRSSLRQFFTDHNIPIRADKEYAL